MTSKCVILLLESSPLHLILTKRLGLLQPIKYGQSNAVWLLRLSRKGTCSSTWFSWDSSSRIHAGRKDHVEVFRPTAPAKSNNKTRVNKSLDHSSPSWQVFPSLSDDAKQRQIISIMPFPYSWHTGFISITSSCCFAPLTLGWFITQQ